jgi:hypothetical protein
MKRKYVKPTIASERVFSLAAQACDVNMYCPGLCQSEIMYQSTGCGYYSWKVKDIFCGEITYPLKEKT